MGYDDREEAAEVARRFRRGYFDWLGDQFRWQGRFVTACLSLIMLTMTMGDWVYQDDPFQYYWLGHILDVHAQVDSSDLAAPTHHRMFLYACRWSSGEWLNAILLFAAFVILAGAAEERLGHFWMLVVMLGGIWLGAIAQITINHSDAGIILTNLSRWIQQHLPVWAANSIIDGLRLLFQHGHPGLPSMGPSAAICAAAVIAVLLPNRPASLREQARLLAIAVVMVGVDVSGVLRFQSTPVAWGLRIGGMVFALGMLPVILGFRQLVAMLRFAHARYLVRTWLRGNTQHISQRWLSR